MKFEIPCTPRNPIMIPLFYQNVPQWNQSGRRVKPVFMFLVKTPKHPFSKNQEKKNNPNFHFGEKTLLLGDGAVCPRDSERGRRRGNAGIKKKTPKQDLLLPSTKLASNICSFFFLFHLFMFSLSLSDDDFSPATTSVRIITDKTWNSKWVFRWLEKDSIFILFWL